MKARKQGHYTLIFFEILSKWPSHIPEINHLN
jgi:hypothetical protein